MPAAAGASSGVKKGAGSSAALSPSLTAAADAILPPKKRLVTVNNPVKLQAIRLLGILGEEFSHHTSIALPSASITGGIFCECLLQAVAQMAVTHAGWVRDVILMVQHAVPVSRHHTSTVLDCADLQVRTSRCELR
jgi:hypothetical protein